MRRALQSFLHRFISATPIDALVHKQIAIFASMGFNREMAIDLFKETNSKIASLNATKIGLMESEHLVLFASMAARGENFKRILEIGTFQGNTTKFLGYLFPNSEIDSLDLSQEEIRRNSVYSYGFENSGDKNYSLPNVNFLTVNSLSLLNFSRSYDLIWVDGNHLSPYTISDIVNAIRLVRPEGYVVCDDIYLRKPFIEKNVDLSSISILSALANEGIISYDLIMKRLGRRFNNLLAGSKYIAVIRKRI